MKNNTDKILVEHNTNKVTVITLNNADKRNAFDKEMSKTVTKTIIDANSLKQKIIVIKSNISHGVFSAGHDLNELVSAKDIDNDPMFEMFDAIFDSEIPVIAQVEGDVYAGGLHLLMVCDMVYALDSASVVITANKMGVPFNVESYQKWLNVMGVHKIKELFFTAGKIDANDAYNCGIFNSIYPNIETLNTKVDSVCEQILSCTDYGITNTKKQLNAIIDNVSLDSTVLSDIDNDRAKILSSPEFKEAVEALIAKIHKH